MCGVDGRRFSTSTSQLMGVNIGHGDRRVTEAIAPSGRDARVHLAVPGVRGARAARAEDWPSCGPATSRRRSSRSAAPRRTRTRSRSRKHVHRTAQDAWLATASYHGATYGTMTLTGDPRRWPNEQPPMPGVVHVLDPYHGPQRGLDDAETALAMLEETIELEGPRHDRGVHPGDRHRHERHPDPARRLPAGRPRALHEVRHRDDRRRGDVRLGPDR